MQPRRPEVHEAFLLKDPYGRTFLRVFVAFESGGAGGGARQVVAGRQKPIGRALDRVVRADAVESPAAQLLPLSAVAPEREQTVCQTLRIVGLHEQAAAGLFDDLGKRSAAR